MENDADASGPVGGLTDFTMLNPVSKKAMYTVNIVMFALLAAAGILVTVYVPEPGRIYLIVMWAIVGSALVYLAAAPPIFYTHYRYRMDNDCIEVRSGVIFHSHVLVPVERVHQVEVNKGPVLRKFGLANVTVTTAGGTVTLQYLDEPVAEYIADNLNEKIIKLLKARE